MKPDAVITTTAASAPTTLCVGAEPALETSQPTRLISVTTMTPSQNLRYAIYSFVLSSFDTTQAITSAYDLPLARALGAGHPHRSSFTRLRAASECSDRRGGCATLVLPQQVFVEERGDLSVDGG